MDPYAEADDGCTCGSLQRMLLQKDDGSPLYVVETWGVLHQGSNVVSVMCTLLCCLYVPILDMREGARLGGF